MDPPYGSGRPRATTAYGYYLPSFVSRTNDLVLNIAPGQRNLSSQRRAGAALVHHPPPVVIDKVVPTAAQAVADIPDGASLVVGGFGLVGVPEVLINALLEQGARALEIVSNNCGTDGTGLGVLLAARRIRRTISSYIGQNAAFAP